MSKRRRKTKSNKARAVLRYGTFVLVILAIAWLGMFFYNKNFKVSTLLPLVEKIQGEAPPAAWTATLYFGDESGKFLIKEHRIITSGQKPEKKAAALLQALLQGPISRGTRTLPQQTHERSVACEKGILTADFTQELKKNHPGGSASEMLTIYSVVNTLTDNIPDIKKVRFTIEGKQTDTIAGHIDCRQPIGPRPDLIR